MKKFRTLQDIDFIGMKAGYEFIIEDDCYEYTHYSEAGNISMHILSCTKRGWLERVEEPKSLEEKIDDRKCNFWDIDTSDYRSGRITGKMGNELAKIARDHFLAVFDTAYKEYVYNGFSEKESGAAIRQALKEA